MYRQLFNPVGCEVAQGLVFIPALIDGLPRLCLVLTQQLILHLQLCITLTQL